MAAPVRDPRPYVRESRDMSRLASAFRAAVERVVARLEAEGFDPMVFETLRTRERQWWIFGKGRTAEQCVAAGVPAKYAWPEGARATNANSYLVSVHGHGLAVDIVSKSKLWGASAAFWKALGEAVRDEGLTWGGDWKSPVDRPHVQWRLVRGGKAWAGPSAEDRARTHREGMEATWRYYGADTAPDTELAA